MICVHKTEAQKSTAQAGVDTLLNIEPLDIQIRGTVAKTTLRLRETGMLKISSHRHSTILHEMDKRRIFEQASDKPLRQAGRHRNRVQVGIYT